MSAVEPAFVDVDGRRLFTLRFRAVGERRGRVLVLPPFAEEMNKCRRLMAQTARALAVGGREVLIPDLYGTGDSAGDFGDASWSGWRTEVEDLARRFFGAIGDEGRGVLAVRSGALLLDVPGLVDAAHVVAWHPVLEGERLLQQFLRLRVMAARFVGRNESVAALRTKLDAGEAVEVAGYRLAPALAAGLAAARLNPAVLSAARFASLLEIRTTGDAAPSPPFARFSAAAQAAGAGIDVRMVVAEQFWASQEIAAPGAVTAATCSALLED